MKSGDKVGDVMGEYQHIQAEDEEKGTREYLGVVLDNGGLVPIWHADRPRPHRYIGLGMVPKGQVNERGEREWGVSLTRCRQ